jgi:flagellar hook-length control protein FliK
LPQAARGLLEARREGPVAHPFASLLQPARPDAVAGAQTDGVMPEVPVMSRDGRPPVVPPPAPADHLGAPIPARVADAGTDEAAGPASGLPRSPVLAGSTVLSPTIAASLLQMGVPEPVGGRAWPAAISDRIMWMVQGEQQVAKLKLNPPNLGPIEVRLTLNQDQASIVFAAHHAAVRDALEAAMPRLRELLEQQSLQLVQADVHDPGGQRDGAADTTRHGHPSFGDRPAGDTPEDGVASPLQLAAVSHGAGLIDLFA